MDVRPGMLMAGTLLTAALHGGAALAQDGSLKQTLDKLLPGMGAEQGFEEPQQRWQEICFHAGAPGHEQDRKAVCMLMAAKVASPAATPSRARVWLLGQLQRIGRDECVEAIASASTDKDRLVQDAAIRALAGNPAPAAGERLIEALKTATEPAQKIAIINALGYRAEASATNLLISDLRSDRDEVAAAAARALGKLPTAGAIDALKSALAVSRGKVKLQVGDALANHGKRLLAQGDTSGARAIADLLYQPDQPARLAGLEGLLKTAGETVASKILETLARGEPAETAVAVGYVAMVDSKGIRQLADGLPSLPPTAQVALLNALGARRDRAALPAVVAAASSPEATVRSASLAALGGLGNGSTVPLLVRAISGGGGLADVARHSLGTVFGDGVDQALIETMKRTEDRGQRALLIEVLDSRRASAAVPALLEEVGGDDANVRRRAILALGKVAGPADVAGMVRGLLTIRDAVERDEAGRAIAEVCARIADDTEQADPVLAEFRKASDVERDLLLPVLGRIGGAKSLELIRQALASPDPARQAGGQQALFEWPDTAVAEDLVALATKAQDKAIKTRAIRSLARVAVAPGARQPDDRLAVLMRGMQLADGDEERRLLLDRAREVHTFASVEFAAQHMSNPKLAAQAIASVVDLLHREEIRKPHQAEADKILDGVIQISKDKSLVERAKSFRSAR